MRNKQKKKKKKDAETTLHFESCETITARSVAYKLRLGYQAVLENQLVLFVPIIEKPRSRPADTNKRPIYDEMININIPFPSAFLAAFSSPDLYAHKALAYMAPRLKTTFPFPAFLQPRLPSAHPH